MAFTCLWCFVWYTYPSCASLCHGFSCYPWDIFWVHSGQSYWAGVWPMILGIMHHVDVCDMGFVGPALRCVVHGYLCDVSVWCMPCGCWWFYGYVEHVLVDDSVRVSRICMGSSMDAWWYLYWYHGWMIISMFIVPSSCVKMEPWCSVRSGMTMLYMWCQWVVHGLKNINQVYVLP